MARLLILIFMLNTLLPSMGMTAMLPMSMDNTMRQTASQMMAMKSSDLMSMSQCVDGMDTDASLCDSDENTQHNLCKVNCATTCAQIPALSFASLLLSIPLHSSEPIAVFAYFYTRSISPELRPPSFNNLT